ncbi:unnamed protein product [Schistosoma curassoni]|uniref:Uncharacterized protein n=1 Tax=Schistosoma curassoni TaxID=6186 RepID=A0A183JJ73_9TREM|nr:unnamed protein product [Schistosoma curassoni]
MVVVFYHLWKLMESLLFYKEADVLKHLELKI